MRFKKNVPDEHRVFLREQLKQYKTEIRMTKGELRDLEEWVSSGRSPYDNGDYICTDDGYPMDFINAQRCMKAEMEWFSSLSDDDRMYYLGQATPEYNPSTKDIYRKASDYDQFLLNMDPDEELPFS